MPAVGHIGLPTVLVLALEEHLFGDLSSITARHGAHPTQFVSNHNLPPIVTPPLEESWAYHRRSAGVIIRVGAAGPGSELVQWCLLTRLDAGEIQYAWLRVFGII